MKQLAAIIGIWRRCSAADHDLVKVNPTRARRFAQAISRGVKTDRVDAAMLARMGAVIELDAKPVRSETMHEIRGLHIARRALNKDRTACRNRLEAARNKVVLAQLRACRRQVDSQLEQIDTERRASSPRIPRLPGARRSCAPSPASARSPRSP